VDTDQIDATSLPPFSNVSRCPRCRVTRWGTLVHFCPGCRAVYGAHFHRICPYGVTWKEAGASSVGRVS